MNQTLNRKTDSDRSTLPILAGGIIALAVAMGIGRFAFTPMLPLMLRDGIIDIATGTEWAAANYIGYLIGALSASRFGKNTRRGIMLGLAGIGITTLGIVFAGASVTWLGTILRGASGIFSAWVLVCTSGWCLNALAAKQASGQGSWLYTGVGLGITVTGVLTWLGGQQSAATLWIELGALACAGAMLAMVCMKDRAPVASAPAQHTIATSVSEGRQGSAALVICYGTFGFGYIIPATFLPTMARQLTSDPQIFGLTWPIFGFAAAVSVALVSRWMSGWKRIHVWALAQGCMALGTLLPLFVNALWAIAVSAVLVGGTFMVATMAGLQLARERMPADPTRLLGRMTAGFAAGQIIGPLVVRAIGPGEIAGWDAFGWANAIATVLLAVTAVWLWRMERSQPLSAARR
ncbi:YbfB/YjiJ family MFS transporter [Janthinobacterium sp. 17J80-10]|uniref:YbfB/YjiJ family MFS transporter n=1 Tax=Janthinobacterium sp. 17J80-10 TaxID=2497863 RepID=UPI0010056A28|nr:YbfB/YjiJ family MFS transporter [Janthinobacterium sp. 17J80-10]QAU32955.1 YbfB/YjiJ family MFS transporter [Janthinobacterium sp. 17J80-10]